MSTSNTPQGDSTPDTTEAKIREILDAFATDIEVSRYGVETGTRNIGHHVSALERYTDTATQQLKGLLVDAQEKTLEDFRLFVFGRHYDGTWDGAGSRFNGMVDYELREYASHLTNQKNQVQQTRQEEVRE